MNIEEQIRSHARQQEERMRIVIKTVADTTTDLDFVHKNGICTSAFIKYDEQDVFNAMRIFFHVASNYAINHGLLTNENVDRNVSEFARITKHVFGVDMAREAVVSVVTDELKRQSK